MLKLWVKFGESNVTQVSTNECENIDAFIKAVKKKLLNQLGHYDSKQISISWTAGGTIP